MTGFGGTTQRADEKKAASVKPVSDLSTFWSAQRRTVVNIFESMHIGHNFYVYD